MIYLFIGILNPFMIKNGDIYIIDFGISTFYVDENNKIIENTEKTTLQEVPTTPVILFIQETHTPEKMT